MRTTFVIIQHPKILFAAVDWMKGGFFKHDNKIIACGGTDINNNVINNVNNKV